MQVLNCSILFSCALCALLLVGAVQPSSAQGATDVLKSECDISAGALSAIAQVDIPQTCFEFNGRNRCYYTYIPACASGNIPLVIDLHPLAACPSTYASYSGWFELASSECFVTVWPVGLTDSEEVDDVCWATPGGDVDLIEEISSKPTTSCCCTKFGDENPFSPVDPADAGDADFVRLVGTQVIQTLASESSIDAVVDPKRIYVTGHSNGCYLSFAMAMIHSDFVAAVGCMSGLWITPPAENYTPTPIWSVIGDIDLVVPPSGRDTSDAYAPSYDTGFKRLQQLNGCTGVTTSTVDLPDMDTLFGSGALTTRTATGCENNATIEFLNLRTAGHTPFIGTPESLPPPPLAATTTIDTTALAWEFVSTRQLSEVPPEFVVVPTDSPTRLPSSQPLGVPSNSPSSQPSAAPSQTPTRMPTGRPTSSPTKTPTKQPTRSPTDKPSSQPSPAPTPQPSAMPTRGATGEPTAGPTTMPTDTPSKSPTERPSPAPTSLLTERPSPGPTVEPSLAPTKRPTDQPSPAPTPRPSGQPSSAPTSSPSEKPSPAPTKRPTDQPSTAPTPRPSGQPSSVPTSSPSERPSPAPTKRPTDQPSTAPTPRPSGQPSSVPTSSPSERPSPTPTVGPSNQPSSRLTLAPTSAPSPGPSSGPSTSPTSQPSSAPTASPSAPPSNAPTAEPTEPQCSGYGTACVFSSDCCSNRCVLNECQLAISAARPRLSGDRGGAAAFYNSNGP